MLVELFLLSTFSHGKIETAQTCPIFQCEMSLPAENQCLNWKNNTVIISPCNGQVNQYCPPLYQDGDSYCVPYGNNKEGQSYPGETCTSDKSCYYGTCQNGTCFGTELLEPCQSTDQCNPKYYCLNSQGGSGMTSLALSQFNTQTNCVQDSDCTNQYGCLIYQPYPVQGKCVEYFSLENGESVHECINNVNLLCKSMQCYGNQCIPAQKLERPIDASCNSDDDCYSTYYDQAPFNIQVKSQCNCGYNTQGFAKCNPLSGDTIGLNYQKYLQKWLQSDEVQLCNTTRRLAVECIMDKWNEEDASALIYYMNLFNDYARYTNNPSCVSTVYNSDFLVVEKEVKDFSAILGLAYLSIFLI